jgi:hypothetical protein
VGSLKGVTHIIHTGFQPLAQQRAETWYFEQSYDGTDQWKIWWNTIGATKVNNV